MGCGLAWSQGIVCYMGIQIPHLKGQFWWIGAPIVNYRHILTLAVQKRLNRSMCRLGCGVEWAKGCTNLTVFARWRQCALMGGHGTVTCRITLNHPSTMVMHPMSNYFGHVHLHSRTDSRALRAEMPNTVL